MEKRDPVDLPAVERGTDVRRDSFGRPARTAVEMGVELGEKWEKACVTPEPRPVRRRTIRLRQRPDPTVLFPTRTGVLHTAVKVRESLAEAFGHRARGRARCNVFEEQPRSSPVLSGRKTQYAGYTDPTSVRQRPEAASLHAESREPGLVGPLEEGDSAILELDAGGPVDAAATHRAHTSDGAGAVDAERLGRPLGDGRGNRAAVHASRSASSDSRRRTQDRWTISNTRSKPPGPP